MNLDGIRNEAEQAIQSAQDITALEAIRVKYLGRKGELNKFFDSLKSLSLEEKRTIGPGLQKLKLDLNEFLVKKIAAFQAETGMQLSLDITMPGKKISVGHAHPLTIIEKQIREIFKALNFSVVEGPQIETEFYNFDALNIPKGHPARGMWVNG